MAFFIGILIFPGVAAYFNETFQFTNGDVLGATYEIDRALALIILLIVMRGWRRSGDEANKEAGDARSPLAHHTLIP